MTTLRQEMTPLFISFLNSILRGSPHMMRFCPASSRETRRTHQVIPHATHPSPLLRMSKMELFLKKRWRRERKTPKRWDRGWSGGTGAPKKIRDIIGSWSCTRATFSTNTWGAWTKFLRQWRSLSLPEKQNSAGATTKRCKRSMAVSLIYSKNSARLTMDAETQRWFLQIWRVREWSAGKNCWAGESYRQTAYRRMSRFLLRWRAVELSRSQQRWINTSWILSNNFNVTEITSYRLWSIELWKRMMFVQTILSYSFIVIQTLNLAVRTVQSLAFFAHPVKPAL